MPKPTRWTQEKRYEIVMETIRGKESISAVARKHQLSGALIHRWRERFFEGGRAALAMDGGDKHRSQAEALKTQIEETSTLSIC